MDQPLRINRDFDKLYPPFREKLEYGLSMADAAGLKVYLFEGYRTLERQAQLYAQGRTIPGRIVTNARAGLSMHNYGIAADLVFDGSPKEGIQWSWDGDYVNGKEGSYSRLGPLMEMAGLTWMGRSKTFFEMPHFDLPIKMNVYEMKSIADKHGLAHLWKIFDGFNF